MRPLIEEGPSKSSRAEELLEGSLPSIFVSFVDCFASQTEPTSFFMNGGGTLEVPSYTTLFPNFEMYKYIGIAAT